MQFARLNRLPTFVECSARVGQRLIEIRRVPARAARDLENELARGLDLRLTLQSRLDRALTLVKFPLRQRSTNGQMIVPGTT